MKLFFLSDIHGSAYYLKKAFEAYKREKAGGIVLLGDALYHGARNPLPRDYAPKEVTAMLNAHASEIIAVRGNCDSEVDAMVIHYPMMASYSWLRENGRRFFLTHGHLYGEENLPPLAPGDVFCYGHTHIPKAEKHGEIFILNPGSISLPKENTPHSYGVLDGETFTVKDLDGVPYRSVTF